ncbi:ABC transporter substrate binding protein [Thalassotalea ganghwensis]
MQFSRFWRMLLVLLSLLQSHYTSATSVLLLNSYHPQYRWTEYLTKGVQQALSDTISQEDLSIEYMDERRFIDDEAYHQMLVELLLYKYRDNRPNVIITSDDAAYNFMLKNGQQLFPDIPVVFSGVNMYHPDQLVGKRNFTGIAEGMEIKENLALIKRLQPDVRKILVLGDTTGLGLQMVKNARKVIENWPYKDTVDIEVFDQFSYSQLYKTVSELSLNSAIFILAVHKDSEGEYFSYLEQLPKLSAMSRAPIYGMWGGIMIDYGALGGVMNDPFEHGFNVATIAKDILSGTPVSSIPVQEKATYKPRVDYPQLVRYGLRTEHLPANTIIINQPFSFYQKNKQFVHGVVAIFALLLLLIVSLVINIKSRVKAQNKLAGFNQELEQLVQERTEQLEQRNQELTQISNSMQKLAYTDSLTELSNRRSAYRDIPPYLQRYSQSNQTLALLIVDIDNFKSVNDQHGHDVGDLVIKGVAKTLNDCIRPSDYCYRWGGEEFLIVITDADVNKLTSFYQRLLEGVRTIKVNGVPKVTISIGATGSNQNDNFESLVKKADVALYQAKERGRDQVVVN